MDSRIGNKFLRASVGFGGSCFQKDILNLVYICECLGLTEVAAYWQQVIDMNDYQKRRFAEKVVQSLFNTVAEKRIAMLGFAFKKNTADTRETASIYVAKYLLKEHAKIAIFDPQVPESTMRRDFVEYDAMPDGYTFEDRIEVCKSANDACAGAHAILVLTEWDEFQVLDYEEIFASMAKPAFIFDGRNILNLAKLREIGFQTYGIGQPLTGDRSSLKSAKSFDSSSDV